MTGPCVKVHGQGGLDVVIIAFFITGYKTRTRKAPGNTLPLDLNLCKKKLNCFDDHAAFNACEVSVPACVKQAPDAQPGAVDCSFGDVLVARELFFSPSANDQRLSHLPIIGLFRRVPFFSSPCPPPLLPSPFLVQRDDSTRSSGLFRSTPDPARTACCTAYTRRTDEPAS